MSSFSMYPCCDNNMKLPHLVHKRFAVKISEKISAIL